MGTVTDAKFYGVLTRALSGTPYQRLTAGTSASRSLILKALDDEIIKAVYVTMIQIPRDGVTTRELMKNWTQEGMDLTLEACKTLAKAYGEVASGAAGVPKSVRFETLGDTVEVSTEQIGYNVSKIMNSGLFRFECQVRVVKGDA